MKNYWKNVPSQVFGTYAVMVLCFTLISLLRGVQTASVARLAQMFGLAVIGGCLMELAFGTSVIRTMSDIKRVCVFTIPFCIVTFLFAILFGWITKTDQLSTYLIFIGIFLACGIITVLLFEIERRIRGRKYTRQLKAYQKQRREAQ